MSAEARYNATDCYRLSSVVCLCVCLSVCLLVMQKRLKRSRCRLEGRLGCAQGTMGVQIPRGNGAIFGCCPAP